MAKSEMLKGSPMTDLAFFLGGQDLEMQEIARLIRRAAPGAPLYDKGLAWGAAVSDYAGEIDLAVASGFRPVLVELTPDHPVPGIAVIIDHHGPAAGQDCPTSLEQVFDLLGLPATDWSRRLQLVSANDRGHIPALRAMAATKVEIDGIRRDDRAAQGITAAMEKAGEDAVANLESWLDGQVLVARLLHGRSAVVTDRLDQDDRRPLVVLSPAEVNVYGPGTVIQALDRAWPDGWYGGALPGWGYWGHTAPVPDEAALQKALLSGLEQ